MGNAMTARSCVSYADCTDKTAGRLTHYVCQCVGSIQVPYAHELSRAVVTTSVEEALQLFAGFNVCGG
jgi:hypothetical protein